MAVTQIVRIPPRPPCVIALDQYDGDDREYVLSQILSQIETLIEIIEENLDE